MVTLGGGATEGQDFADAAELNPAEGAGNVRQAVVEADVGMMKPIVGFLRFEDVRGIGYSALVAEAAKTVSMGLGVGQDCPAFAGGDLLVGVKTKDREIAESADAALIKLGADGFAGVFDDDEIVACGESTKCMHVGWDSEGVDDEDGARARRDEGFNG